MKVELLLNDGLYETLVPGATTITLHVQSSMPMGSDVVTFLISEGLDRRVAPRHDLNIGDVIEARVIGEHGDDAIKQGFYGTPTKGDGAVSSPEPRFAIDLNGVRAAIVGTPGPGGLSVDLSLTRNDGVIEIALRAKGRTHDTYWQWGFPYLKPGDVVRIEVLAPGPADAPGLTQPRVSSPGL